MLSYHDWLQPFRPLCSWQKHAVPLCQLNGITLVGSLFHILRREAVQQAHLHVYQICCCKTLAEVWHLIIEPDTESSTMYPVAAVGLAASVVQIA